MAFEKIKQMIGNIRGKLTDDEGLFQGGKYGRLGGRYRDWAEETSGIGHSPKGIGRRMERRLDMEEGSYPQEGPMATRDFEMARTGALDFDPSNEQDVLMMQKRLNQVLPEGSRLKEDAMFGPKTEAALRMVQGMAPEGGGEGLMQFLPKALQDSMISGAGNEPQVSDYTSGDMDFAKRAMGSMGFSDDFVNAAASGVDARGQGVDARGQGVNATGSGAGRAADIARSMKSVPWMKKIADTSGY